MKKGKRKVQGVPQSVAITTHLVLYMSSYDFLTLYTTLPHHLIKDKLIDLIDRMAFMERGKVLTTNLLSQGYQKTKLVATLRKFFGRHHDLVNPYNVAVSRIVSDVFANDEP